MFLGVGGGLVFLVVFCLGICFELWRFAPDTALIKFSPCRPEVFCLCVRSLFLRFSVDVTLFLLIILREID